MLTSKELLDQTGISRATLNNYIALGLIPKPEVKRASPTPGAPLTTLGYFPQWVLERIQSIQQMKRAGVSMQAISLKFSQQAAHQSISEAKAEPAPVENKEIHGDLLDFNHEVKKDSKTNELTKEFNQMVVNNNSLHVSIDKIPYPAYMINYDSKLVWLNQSAQTMFFGDQTIPDRDEERSLIPTLYKWAQTAKVDELQNLFGLHFSMLKHRFNRDSFNKNCMGVDQPSQQWLEQCYLNASTLDNALTQETAFDQPGIGQQRLFAMSFREGVLFTYIPTKANANDLLEWLSQRDSVIRTLLSQRLPVLTPLVAMVADLQNSVRICSELPPDEYFQLINEIWSTLDPIFRRYYGAYGKHTGDGMVYYFFPQPDTNYLLNAIYCACEIKETMRKISANWALKKGWANNLYMNIGLNEGEEWLGTFKTNTSYELVVLGDTMNMCGRLSDFAKFGQIWASKNLVSKLSTAEKSLLEYGVMRSSADQDVFVYNTFAQIGSLLKHDDPKTFKIKEFESYAITEIKKIQKD